MEDEVRLEAGKLVLFRRSGLWQARIHLGQGRYLWRSLKTANSNDARRAGIRLLYQIEHKLSEGLPVHIRTLNAVIDEYVAHRQRDHDVGMAAAAGRSVIPPLLTGFVRRTHAAIFSFCAGVMPPIPMFGRSLL